MYGLAKDLDLSFLKGRTLVQLCFGLHDMTFNFDGDLSIHVEVSIEIAMPTGEKLLLRNYAKAAEKISILLDDVIDSSSHTADGILNIDFIGGASLTIRDDNRRYESYIIRHAGREIVV